MKNICICTRSAGGELNTGESKLWGSPDLPHSFDYPSYEDEDGEDFHYVFIGQINCSQLSAADPDGRLPHHGMLYFFAKIDFYMGEFIAEPLSAGWLRKGDVKVFYYPKNDVRNMEQFVLVDDEEEEVAPRELKIDFFPSADPAVSGMTADSAISGAAENPGTSGAAVAFEASGTAGKPPLAETSGQPSMQRSGHRMLGGLPEILPAEVAAAVQEQYVLLLELCTSDIDGERKLDFGPGGRLCFFIPAADLARPTFKNVRGYLDLR